MVEGPIQRSGLPLLILSAVIFVAGTLVVLLVMDPFSHGLFATGRPGQETSRRPAESAPSPSEPAGETPLAREPAPEPAPPSKDAEPAPPPAPSGQPADASLHTVVRGNTLFDLAGAYWSDPYLWPLILDANRDRVQDPDYLRQGLQLRIPASPLRDGRLPAAEVPPVTRAHILAHERYKALGNQSLAAGRESGNPWAIQRGLIRINKSHWVLYSGLRYDERLLDAAEGKVSADDIRVVRTFIERFGPGPGSR